MPKIGLILLLKFQNICKFCIIKRKKIGDLMDLFEFAKSAMEHEVKEKEEQELLEAPAKSYKVDIFEALRNVAQKNYGWLS